MLFSGNKENPNRVPLGKVADEVSAGQVNKIEVADNDLTVFLKDGTKQISTKEKEAALSDTLKNTYGVDVSKIKAANIEPKSRDRKSTRLNSSHQITSHALFSLKKKNNK